MPCTARAADASGIRSIPAIQGAADHGRSTQSRRGGAAVNIGAITHAEFHDVLTRHGHPSAIRRNPRL
jgi:hypothetical protein